MYCCYSKCKEPDVPMLVCWTCDNIADSKCAGAGNLTTSLMVKRSKLGVIAPASTDLTSVPFVSSQNRKSTDIPVDRSVPATQGRKSRSTELEIENGSGGLVQLRIMAPRKLIFPVRAAAHKPIDDIL
uniref:Uncharacterized protein n=1 Tax=Glossina pallidipes TaxID=7398 RepID=A0A1A9ZMY6_GLOPL